MQAWMHCYCWKNKCLKSGNSVLGYHNTMIFHLLYAFSSCLLFHFDFLWSWIIIKLLLMTDTISQFRTYNLCEYSILCFFFPPFKNVHSKENNKEKERVLLKNIFLLVISKILLILLVNRDILIYRYMCIHINTFYIEYCWIGLVAISE